MTALHDLLDHYRATAQTVRELGTYFEELTISYLKHEPAYRGDNLVWACRSCNSSTGAQALSADALE